MFSIFSDFSIHGYHLNEDHNTKYKQSKTQNKQKQMRNIKNYEKYNYTEYYNIVICIY